MLLKDLEMEALQYKILIIQKLIEYNQPFYKKLLPN